AGSPAEPMDESGTGPVTYRQAGQSRKQRNGTVRSTYHGCMLVGTRRRYVPPARAPARVIPAALPPVVRPTQARIPAISENKRAIATTRARSPVRPNG